ncbi:lipocalin family protein [Cereibacter sphaeroides]|uniref:lipocalin family protein n=1 Tax=Rhodobacterales TaxID=204455 RepID=UPI000BBF25C5|nr:MULTISPECIES: lipocalin family protein [Paracoccaceae]MCE6951051.1 lipocalin family protein [Cereibacter sphaeroides]MCE6957827.1 lipocalin family protein [Cereibacter sphaeroides]MCE6969531.1 lipocalin family protein [Cereibacter sphaeroides]MCE6972711.1 lipocalin family protein [Cereibacter sphaeroides]
MSRLSFLSLLLLAACAAKAPPPPSVAFRDTGTPIWSNATLEPARLAGEWREVAAFAAPGACRPGGATITTSGNGLAISGRVCLGGRETALGGPLAVTGPGRLLPAGGTEPWWVLWADTDYRTLAIGTPSGRFGFILNRGGPLPPDRLTAAREILDWNGYDLARLTLF